ncbi:MAG TPA: hypothetical protein VGD84_02430, partial [Pseudonocardiaceae bacterium]
SAATPPVIVLAMLNPRLSGPAERVLRRRGVDVRLRTTASEITHRGRGRATGLRDEPGHDGVCVALILVYGPASTTVCR